MTEHSEIKTRAGGSIDTGHYMAHGRELRSLAFLNALGRLRRAAVAFGRRPARKGTAHSSAAAPRPVPAE